MPIPWLSRVIRRPNGAVIVDGLSFDASKLPSDLRHLAPLILKWSVGDDALRQKRVQQASEEELSILINAVVPRFNRINQHLDSLGKKPLSTEAILLGNLAELVAELTVASDTSR